ncbi:phosphopantetheine-binding protein [Streptomyces sp. NPDC088733]|uniref:phosphopantetheine-binding protein n=1 Tax=Streptomyces sp. NPDC088733 TaxID=3365880 RepID=UPI003830C393
MTVWNQQFEDILRGHLPFLGAQEPLAEDLPLRELGLDSMGTVELLSDLETAYGVHFRDDNLTPATFHTPAALWAVIDGLRPRSA